MSMREKYLEALQTLEGWVIVSEWAQRFGEINPDLLAKAEREAENQANETTGLREIAARISSVISNGAYKNKIEIDTSSKNIISSIISIGSKLNNIARIGTSVTRISSNTETPTARLIYLFENKPISNTDM